MKKLFLLTLSIFICGSLILKGQSMAPTTAETGWGRNTDQGYDYQSLSNSSFYSFPNNGSGIPWYPSPLSPPPSGNNTFLSISSHNDVYNGVSTTVSGLTAGKNYIIKYNISAALAHFTSTNKTSVWPNSAITVIKSGPSQLASSYTSFSVGINTNKWLKQQIMFKATGPTATFYVETETPGITRGIINLDMPANPIEAGCNFPDVALNTNTLYLKCPTSPVNLNSAYNGVLPAGVKLVWWGNNSRTGWPVLGPEAISQKGTYYAFLWDEAHDCWNTDLSTNKVSIQDFDIQLTSNVAYLTCGANSYNINNLIANTLSVPSGSSIKWFKNNNHSAADYVANPSIVGPGTYYAFLYTGGHLDCYASDQSTTKVTVIDQVPVNLAVAGVSPKGYISCAGEATYDLNKFVSNDAQYKPAGYSIVWYDNPNHAGVKLINPSLAAPGTYYAFFNNGNCYNTAASTAKVEIIKVGSVDLAYNLTQVVCDGMKAPLPQSSLTGLSPFSKLRYFKTPNPVGDFVTGGDSAVIGEYYVMSYDTIKMCYSTYSSSEVFTVKKFGQVSLAGENEVLDCGGKFNLTALGPPGFVRWFTSPTRNGKSQVMKPEAVGAGTYYAFYYDAKANCYSVDSSTAKKVIIVKPCAATVNIKVSLQGPMPTTGTTMRNALQNYFGEFIGLLPSTDPYNGGVVYADINNPGAAAGTVVDWVKVEIRSALNPATILESKSLLLKPDGSIVGVDGLAPSFTPQTESVHIVIKHRNHLAIMGQPIGLNSTKVDYDFTNALNKAFNDGTAPDQMKLVNGVWCMWAGDINVVQDNVIEAADVTRFKADFKNGINGVYKLGDLNMDGYPEAADATIFIKNFKSQYNSIINKY